MSKYTESTGCDKNYFLNIYIFLSRLSTEGQFRLLAVCLRGRGGFTPRGSSWRYGLRER